jgi:hypothetical protein
MAIFDPLAVPFYEQQRGGGEVTTVMARQERARAEARLREVEQLLETTGQSRRAASHCGQRSIKDDREYDELMQERQALLDRLAQPRKKFRASRR